MSLACTCSVHVSELVYTAERGVAAADDGLSKRGHGDSGGPTAARDVLTGTLHGTWFGSPRLACQMIIVHFSC